jgi:phospholipase D1/2
MFAPAAATAYAVIGSLLGAAATYLIGRLVGRGPLRSLMGPRVNRISRALARQGVLSVAAIRMVPIAPFTFVNLAAGASHIRFADYILGTLLGMVPGIVVIALLGTQLAEVLRAPSPAALGLLAAGLLGWLALSLGLQYVASRLRSG